MIQGLRFIGVKVSRFSRLSSFKAFSTEGVLTCNGLAVSGIELHASVSRKNLAAIRNRNAKNAEMCTEGDPFLTLLKKC